MKFRYTKHAVERMIERNLTIEEIENAVKNGTIIKEYLDDKPYPSFLILYKTEEKTLHVVYSITKDIQGIQTNHIITFYEPKTLDWSDDFTKRREPK